MRRQLVGTVAATTSLVLIALLVPMITLINRFALEDALARTGLEVQATESVVALRERADLVTFIADQNGKADGTRTTVVFADGDVIGPDREVTADVVEARQTGRAITNSTPEGVEVLVPVAVGPAQTPAGPRPTAESLAVIRVVINQDRPFPDVLVSWAIMALLGLGLLGLALFVADRLARNLLRSVSALAETAEELEAGRLEARAAPSGPAEIRDVGHALNRLASRITELLADERASAADLSHRLRTPLMALRLEADELSDPEERARVSRAVEELSDYVNTVINEVRRPVREGLGACADATAVVRSRTAFWAVLAEDQNRPTSVQVPSAPVLVKVSPDDLEAAVDALLENVFSHTEEGVGFTVTLTAAVEGGADLVVTDEGGAIARDSERTASTGLGLDIVRRTAAASGGEATVRPDSSGTTVRVRLGPPDAYAAGQAGAKRNVNPEERSA